MSEWKETPFGELLVESKDGEWGQGEGAIGLEEVEIIRGTDFSRINDPQIHLPRRWIKSEIVKRKKLYPGDILIETAGGTATQSTGRTALLRQIFFKQHNQFPVLCASFSRFLRLNIKDYNSVFIYYLLQALYKAGYMAVYNIQHTGVSRFQYTTFKNKTVLKIPLLPVQKKIAAVLSAYDDLIENNDRRIALLEKMAEEIYREWFVRLRFPGHEQATFHKGIPEGWHVRELKDTDISIIDGDRGNNYPRKDEFSESGYCLFLNTGNIKNDRFVFSKNDFITKQKDSILRKGKLIENDIILTTRGTVGSVAFYSNNSAYQNVRINSGMVILRSKNAGENSLYYYYLMKSSLLKEQYKLYSSGAAQPQLPIKDLKRINVLIPPQELLSKFSGLVGTLNEQLDRYQLVNGNLKQTRDRLLTRLISGKLSVEDLDIQFPPSMTDLQ